MISLYNYDVYIAHVIDVLQLLYFLIYCKMDLIPLALIKFYTTAFMPKISIILVTVALGIKT